MNDQNPKVEPKPLTEEEPPPCGTCNLPMAQNPHSLAGKPETLLKVGATWVCVPCTVESRHGWVGREMDARATIRNLRARVEALEGAHDPLIRAATVEWETENRLLREALEELKDKLRVQVDESCFQNDRAEKAEAEAVEWQEHSRVSIQQDGESIKRLGQEMDETKRLREALETAPHNKDCDVLHTPNRPCNCHKAALAGEKTT